MNEWRVRCWTGGKWRVASGEWRVRLRIAAGELELVVEKELAGGGAGLDG